MLAVAPGCEMEVERGPDWLLVRIRGFEGDFSDSCLLAEQLWSLMERHFTYRLVLELDEIQMLNSYLLGQLIQLHKRAERSGGIVRVCGLSDYNCRVLHSTHLDELFRPYPSRQEAVMGCSRPHQPR
jgi:anti-anti-sigma factor